MTEDSREQRNEVATGPEAAASKPLLPGVVLGPDGKPSVPLGARICVSDRVANKGP